jgi:hypothetical protein
MSQNPDRVTYSISRKISTADYENVTITYGYASDLNKGESLKDGTKRVVDHVEDFIEGKETKIKEQLEEQG